MKHVIILVVAICSLAFGYLFFQIPSEEQIKGCIKTKMYAVDLCPTSKKYVKLNQISIFLQKAIISTEDSKFYQHTGFDTEGIETCIEKIKEKKRLVCGGSTITQQLAKNMFLTKDKTFYRKGLEAIITKKIESSLNKKEILERYLNVIQFGKDTYGIRAAAQHYFKKSPSQLDVVESAFLAMILPNPEKYASSYYRKDLTRFARRRINQIIENMHSFKMIDDDAYQTAVARVDSFLIQGQMKIEAVDPTVSTSTAPADSQVSESTPPVNLPEITEEEKKLMNEGYELE